MKFNLALNNPFWWLWVITIGFIISAISGWKPGYFAVMALSFVQILIYLVKEKDKFAFPTQVRIVYFLLSLVGLWTTIQLPFYALLLFSTFMGTFLGRCMITLMLKRAAWNQTRAASLY